MSEQTTEISEHENYFMQLVNVDEIDVGFMVFDVDSYNTIDQQPLTPIKFQSAEKAWNWWFHQCRNNSSIMSAANTFAQEAARYRRQHER